MKKTFGIDSDLEVHGFKNKTQWVPEIDETYIFDKDTTLAILAGFEHDRRVMVQGYHGTGKSTHIEQVAARPCSNLLNMCRFSSSMISLNHYPTIMFKTC